MKTVKLFIQCKSKSGKTGSFLIDEKGNELTDVFKNTLDLFKDEKYKEIKNIVGEENILVINKI